MANDIPMAHSADGQPDDAATLLADAYRRWEDLAIRHKRACLGFRASTAVFAPVAILLLTVQTAVAPGPMVSAVLIGLAMAALVTALLAAVLPGVTNPRQWVDARLRAETLRRERFLLAARIGPYLQTRTPEEVHARVQYRLMIIDSIARDPTDVLVLRDPGGYVTWRDALEDAGIGHTAAPEPGCVEMYLHERLRDQRNWYEAKSRHWALSDDVYERSAVAALIMGLVCAAIHLTMVWTGARATSPLPEVIRVLIVVGAVLWPAVAVGVTGLRSARDGWRISYVYADTARLIAEAEADLLHLVGQAKSEVTSSGETSTAVDLQVKRVVLRAEEALTAELRQWYRLTAW